MNTNLMKRNLKKNFNSWWVISFVGAVVILLPILFIFSTLFQEPNANWQHIREFLLTHYVMNTIVLVGLTGVFTAILGVSLAWLIAAYDFPLRKFFRFGLLLPLAIPTFIAAYTYRTMLGYTGVIQSTLRNEYDVHIPPELLSITGIKGAVFIFTMFLFPYVYMITRAFLESQSSSYIESARLLGQKPLAIFFKIVLPLARPAIVGGTVLVLFEVLGDYGLTSLLGIHTISTAIFQTWFGMYDVNSAMRLAAWLMIIIMGVYFLEKLLRQRRRYHLNNKSRPLVPVKLKGIKAISAFVFCGVVLLISFLIPVIQLIAWAIMTFDKVWDASMTTLITQTVSLAALSTIVILIFAVIVANVSRSHSTFSFVFSKIMTSGYSIPGPIIAIGVLAIFIMLDQSLAPVYRSMGLGEKPLILSLSLTMLVVGYFIRFMATGFNAIEVGYEKIGTKYTEASRMLGLGLTKTFFKVEFPLLRGAILSGFVLTFVEICKELPLALLLRPFNFETLATKTYQYAHDEQIHEASISSLLIIGISILAVVIIQVLGKRVKK